MKPFEMSLETQQLIQRLEELEEGELVAWDELSELVGRDCRREANGLVWTARRHCERHLSVTFETVPKKGVRRLKNNEIPMQAGKSRRIMHRRAGRAIRTHTCCDPSKLNESERMVYHTYGTQLYFTRKATGERATKLISEKSPDSLLNFDQTVKLFIGKQDNGKS